MPKNDLEKSFRKALTSVKLAKSSTYGSSQPKGKATMHDNSFPMQAIVVKYMGATNSRGSRYKATAAMGESITVSYDHSLNASKNAKRAAAALAEKLGWTGEWYEGGGLKSEYVYVLGNSPAFTVR